MIFTSPNNCQLDKSAKWWKSNKNNFDFKGLHITIGATVVIETTMGRVTAPSKKKIQTSMNEIRR